MLVLIDKNILYRRNSNGTDRSYLHLFGTQIHMLLFRFLSMLLFLEPTPRANRTSGINGGQRVWPLF